MDKWTDAFIEATKTTASCRNLVDLFDFIVVYGRGNKTINQWSCASDGEVKKSPLYKAKCQPPSRKAPGCWIEEGKVGGKTASLNPKKLNAFFNYT